MSLPVQLNLNIRGLQSSSTLRINERCAEMAAAGHQVFRLGFGQSPFPVPASVVEELKQHAHEKDYLPVKGLQALREAVAGFHNRHAATGGSGSDVLVGPGSKELMFLLQLVYYGDLVIPRPSWVSYAPQARIASRHVYWLPTRQEDNWLLTPADLDKFCQGDPTRPRILVLNYPANPTGATYTAAELEKMAEVARRYHVVVLSDEIYGEVHHEGAHVSIAAYYPEGTIISSGLSKWCGAGGWRLGTFAFPPGLRWLLDAMAVAASETFTSTSTPIQHAAVRAFEGGSDIERYLELSRRVLKTVGQAVGGIFDKHHIGHAPAQGGFYLFPVFEHYRAGLAARGIGTSEALCSRLLEETGVALLPASDFGFPDEFLGARLSYVDFDGKLALKLASEEETGGAGEPGTLAGKYAPKVMQGVQAMVDWLNLHANKNFDNGRK